MFRSYGFWTALAGAVVVLLEALGKCFGFNVKSDAVSGVIMAIAGLLVVFGVVSLPKKEKTKEEASENDEKDKDEEKEDD